MTRTTTLLAAALGATLAACGATEKASDPYLASVPDLAALTIDTRAAASPGAFIVDPLPVTTLGDDLAVVHARAQALNDGLREVFARIAEVTATGGEELPNGVKTWGPAARCVETVNPDGTGGCAAEASLRLWVKRFPSGQPVPGASFALEARDLAGTLEFRPVLAGYLVRGPRDPEHRGAGRVWANLDALRAAAPAFRGAGLLAAGFHAGPVAKAAGYRMWGFTRDASLHDPVTAAFRTWKSAAGVTRARVAGFADLDTTGASPELGVWRGVWHPTLGGRAFTVVSNFDSNGPLPGGTIVGDVAPAGTLDRYWFGRACYAPGATTPRFKEWFLCDRQVTILGVPAPNPPHRCAATAPESSHQVVIGAGTWADSCALDPALEDRDGLAPPQDMPGDHEDDRREAGEERLGMSPEDVPTTAGMPAAPAPPGMPGMGGAGGMM